MVERFKYVGNNRVPSCCGVDVYTHPDRADTIIVVTDLGEGLSVTNSWPHLAEQIIEYYELQGKQIIWVEHYLPNRYGHGEEETWDLVKIDGQHEPKWEHLGEQRFRQLTEKWRK